ncbi:MAG TPA: hypothetical protein VIM81_18270 [Gammaproteobacteria bacterium]
MEARIARLESDVAHLRTDMADVKVDGSEQRLDAKIEKLGDSLSAAKVWALALYIALAAAMLGTMARGFEWI